MQYLLLTFRKSVQTPHYHTTTTPSHLIVSHEHFLLAMCLHGSLNCYLCYVLNKDFRHCVKSVQFRVKLVAGCITIFVIIIENLLAFQNIFQPPVTGVQTFSHFIVSHEHFLLDMCLHGSLICYVCYVLNKDFRYCVKSVQFRVKLVAGYITILVINNENLLACEIVLL